MKHVCDARAGWIVPLLSCLLLANSTETMAQVNARTTARRIVYDGTSKPATLGRIDPTPALILDERSGEDFTEVVSVSKMSGGRVAVASLSTNNVRLFGPDGSLVRTIGRAGRGPGEFQGLVELLHKGDTLVAVDASGIAHLFNQSGNYARTEGRPFLPGAVEGRRMGYFPNGAMTLQSAPPRETYAAGGNLQPEFTLWRADANEPVPLAKYPGFEVEQGKNGRYSSVKFGPRGHVSVLDWGFCTAFGNTFAATCFDPGGRQQWTVEFRNRTTLPVTTEMKNEFFRDDSLLNPAPAAAAYRAYTRANTMFAKTLPVLGRLLASRTGEVWLGPMTPADEGARVMPAPSGATRWNVLARDGRWIGEVSLPARFRLMEAGADYVAGVLTNFEDEESVVLYHIRR